MLATGFRSFTELCEVGAIRAPGLMLAGYGALNGMELARRFFATAGRSVGYNLAAQVTEKPAERFYEWCKEDGKLQNAGSVVYNYTPAKRSYKALVAWSSKSKMDCVKDCLSCLAVSILWVEGANVLVGKPHWMYNAVLSNCSPLRMSSESIIANIITNGTQAWNWAQSAVKAA